MTLQEIAIFKRFIGQHELRKNFIAKYRKSIGMTHNPDSIEKYLSNIEATKVITSAVKHFITNEAMGFDFWQSVNESWLQYLVKMRASHSIDQYSPNELRGYYSALRENWDKDRPWAYDPVAVAQLRYGIITPEEAGITADDKKEEQAPADVPEADFCKETDEQPDPLADLDFFDFNKPISCRLQSNEVSINFNNSYKLTFNTQATKRIHESQLRRARLARNKQGDVCIVINGQAGANVSLSKKRDNNNATVNSKDICSKLRTLLDIKPDYLVLCIEELSHTPDFIIYKITKQ